MATVFGTPESIRSTYSLKKSIISRKVWEMKANFDFEENWNINAVPVEKQKLDEIKKQKPEETKKIQDRNKERARKLGR